GAPGAASRGGRAYRGSPASVGSARRPGRSSSCRPSRCSSDRIWRLTAGCVTPSRSAACEKLLRSTTAQKAASWRVSIRIHYGDGCELRHELDTTASPGTRYFPGRDARAPPSGGGDLRDAAEAVRSAVMAVGPPTTP